MHEKARARLLKWIGGPTQDEIDVDEILGLMLQISLAIMMIFMIAFFMFRFQSNREQQKQLIEIQRQQLTVALEKTEQFYRTRYGLNAVTRLAPDGTAVYQTDGLIQDGRITATPLLRDAFVDGGKAAFQDYADALALRQSWWTRVLADAALQPADLDTANWQWLADVVDQKIIAAKTGCREVQLRAAAAIQTHLAQHPDQIGDARIRELLETFGAASEAERRLIVPELTDRLRRHSFSRLNEQAGTPMLETTP